jgi:hypothetical protein
VPAVKTPLRTEIILTNFGAFHDLSSPAGLIVPRSGNLAGHLPQALRHETVMRVMYLSVTVELEFSISL